MKIKYYHGSAYLKNGEFVCSKCGAKLDKYGRSEKPCIIPTANVLINEDYEFAISVWNCEAKLIAYRLDEKGRVHYVSLLIEKNIKEKVNSLILDSIYQVGGAINISGWYPFSKELVEFMKENFKKGKIKIENR